MITIHSIYRNKILNESEKTPKTNWKKKKRLNSFGVCWLFNNDFEIDNNEVRGNV